MRPGIICAAAALTLAAVPLYAGRDSVAKTSLKVDPAGANTLKLGYFPIQVALSESKPADVKKEPTYRTAPKYGVIKLGDGPKSAYVVALDEPADADWRIYLDKNRNGDLTDDGDGEWSKKNVNDKTGRTMYGVNSYTLRASYGDKREKSSADYGLSFYRFADLKALLMYRTAVRMGKIEVAGKSHDIALAENDADALYDKPIDDNGKPLKGGSRPVWLILDPPSAGDPPKRLTTIDVRAPFELDSKVYEARIAPDGSSLELITTTRVAFKPKAPERPALLAKGVKAPDFESDAWGGGKLKLSDYKGKVVILDFWSTWCGPCQQSMPHIEKVHQAVKDKNVVVIGLCVWDTRKAYESWVPENSSKYTFKFAMDPAEKETAKSIATSLYKVSGIPTTYIIDKDGNVVDAIVGYQDGDTRVEDALKKAGVAVE